MNDQFVPPHYAHLVHNILLSVARCPQWASLCPNNSAQLSIRQPHNLIVTYCYIQPIAPIPAIPYGPQLPSLAPDHTV